MCYFHTKFEVDPIKITRKIFFLSVLWLGPILTLTFDLDHNDLIWWLITHRYFYMLTMTFLRCKTKKLKKYSFYVMTSPNDVITSTYLLICKALIKTFHMRYYTIWFLPFQNWPWDTQFSTQSLTMKVKVDRLSNLITWVAECILLS
jgi:hypothetical protein